MSRKKSSPSNIPAVDGRHSMTSLELSEADDLATMMTVDAILGFTTHKMDKNFNPANYDKKQREKWKEIMDEFITELNYEHTYQQLVLTDKIKPHWKKDERFKRHIFRFLYLFDKRSGIEVRPCYRYENEGKLGAAIYATREWERGSQISTLFGCISEVRQSEEEFFHETKNEFSVMYSTRKNCSQLWLGPAAYVNHDCKPNCRFTEANYDSKMTLETLRDIHPNDELLIHYGNNFFGIDNIECECFTCELRGRGYFSYGNKSNQMQNGLSINPFVSITDLYFQSSSITQKPNGGVRSDPARRVMTRSFKSNPPQEIHANGNGNGDVVKSNILTHPFQGALNGLKKSDNSYSLRITYSRIDRVKQKILSKNSSSNTDIHSNHGTSNCISKSVNHVDFRNHKSSNGSLKERVKRKSQLSINTDHKCFKEPLTVNMTPDKIVSNRKSFKIDPEIVTRRSLRNPGAKTVPTKPVRNIDPPKIHEENQSGKLTIKLRKMADHPNQYEHIFSSDSKPTIQKLTIHKKANLKHSNGDGVNSRLLNPDSNIFSRMTELYLSRSDTTTPPPPILQPDTPPSLYPWFCSEKSSSHSSRKSSKAMRIKTRPRKKSKHLLKIVNLSTKPYIQNDCDPAHFDCFPHMPDSANSDIPSYSASSPTIPILEIESETELVPPQLICEIEDQEEEPGEGGHEKPRQLQFLSSNSTSSPVAAKSKGIVMRFSRICGKRFVSLLS